MTDKKITTKLKSLENKREKVFSKYSEIKDELNELESSISFFKEIDNIKPQILFNLGRDKKYVYGQIYYYTKPQSTKKKSYRFLIGKMSDDKSRQELESICMDVFYEKVVKEFV